MFPRPPPKITVKCLVVEKEAELILEPDHLEIEKFIHY